LPQNEPFNSKQCIFPTRPKLPAPLSIHPGAPLATTNVHLDCLSKGPFAFKGAEHPQHPKPGRVEKGHRFGE